MNFYYLFVYFIFYIIKQIHIYYNGRKHHNLIWIFLNKLNISLKKFINYFY